MTKHIIYTEGEPEIDRSVIEYKLGGREDQLTLYARNKGVEKWTPILCIGEDGLLDPTFTPFEAVAGLVTRPTGYIDCVPLYLDLEEEDDDDLPF